MLRLLVLSLSIIASSASMAAQCARTYDKAAEKLNSAELTKVQIFNQAKAIDFLVDQKLVAGKFCRTLHEGRMDMLKLGNKYKESLTLYKKTSPSCLYKKYYLHSSDIIEFTRKHLAKTQESLQGLDQIAKTYCFATTELADTLVEE